MEGEKEERQQTWYILPSKPKYNIIGTFVMKGKK